MASADDMPDNRRENMKNLKAGQKVTTSGFAGTIVRQYCDGMWEVRLNRGIVCVSESDIIPA